MRHHIEYFFSQPHQLFFSLAIISAIISMLLFALGYNGSLVLDKVELDLFHAYSLIFLTFTPIIVGFLFTTFPRFCATEPVRIKHYKKVFFAFFFGALTLYVALFLSSAIWFIATLVLFTAHLIAFTTLIGIYKKSTLEDKEDAYWILVALFLGLLAHALFLLSPLYNTTFLEHLKIEVGLYLYLVFLAFVVGAKMIPFFYHIVRDKSRPLTLLLLTLFMIRALAVSTGLEPIFIIDLIISAVLFREIISWKLPVTGDNPLLWIFHIGVLWLPVGFLIGAFTNLAEMIFATNLLALGAHLVLLGFLTTVVIGFITRVTLGHSHNNMQADKTTRYLFYLTQVVVVVRLGVSLFAGLGYDYLFLVELSALLWLLLFAGWGVHYLPILFYGKNLYKK